jgi:hypothetical protein
MLNNQDILNIIKLEEIINKLLKDYKELIVYINI